MTTEYMTDYEVSRIPYPVSREWLAVQAVLSQLVSCGTTETMAKANQGELWRTMPD